MNARTVLLVIFGAAWLTVVVITAAYNHGQVPNELWPVLGFGVGTIMAAFRIDEFARRDRTPPAQIPPQPPAKELP